MASAMESRRIVWASAGWAVFCAIVVFPFDLRDLREVMHVFSLLSPPVLVVFSGSCVVVPCLLARASEAAWTGRMTRQQLLLSVVYNLISVGTVLPVFAFG